jgi:hypothetical protein
MRGEAEFKARPTTPRTTSLPVVREGRLPTIPLHPPGPIWHADGAGQRQVRLLYLYALRVSPPQQSDEKSSDKGAGEHAQRVAFGHRLEF